MQSINNINNKNDNSEILINYLDKNYLTIIAT